MLLSPAVRSLIVAAGVPVVFVASMVDRSPAGSPTRHTRHASRAVCDPLVPSHRALARTAFSGSAGRIVLRDVVTVVQGRRTKGLGDDDAAIQNGASAVGGEDDQRVLTALEPIGMLAPQQCQLPSHHVVSRHSPRGPPPSYA